MQGIRNAVKEVFIHIRICSKSKATFTHICIYVCWGFLHHMQCTYRDAYKHTVHTHTRVMMPDSVCSYCVTMQAIMFSHACMK